MKKKFSRRMALRGLSAAGIGVTVGLPILEAQLNSHGTAFADGSALPKRFMLFFWGNGVTWSSKHYENDKPDIWTPNNTGQNYELSPLLQAFDGMRERLSVITGLEPKTELGRRNGDANADIDGGQGDGHMRGVVNALTGDRPRPEGFSQPDHLFAVSRPTIDHYLAGRPEVMGALSSGQEPKFKTLVTGVSRARFHSVPDHGTWESISHRGPDQMVAPIQGAGELFTTLFADAPPDDPQARALIAERLLVLDAVKGEFDLIKNQIGRADQERVQAHFDHISDLQRQLQSASSAAFCSPPERKERMEDLGEESVNQAKLIAAAMKCDLARVFSFMLTAPGGQHVFGHTGVGSGLHQTAHDNNWEGIRKQTEYQMQCFRRVLDVFANTQDVDGTSLLDTMMVLGTSEYGEGSQHQVKEFPVLVAGRARGALQPGQHVRIEGGNLSRVHLTVAKAMGIEENNWGWNGAETSQALPILT